MDAAATTRTQLVEHYVVTSVPVAADWEIVGDVRARLQGQHMDDASHVFVLTEDSRLVGIAAIRDILSADAGAAVKNIMRDPAPYRVALDADREDAASQAIREGISILAVCDAEERLLGAVPARALMWILRDEHLQDLHQMAGIMHQSEVAKDALNASPLRRALYRLPWLLVGMAGSAVATATMARFESALATNISVAFFIPAIVYIADAVGTQSEAIAVRGLSLTRANLAPVLGELSAGVMIGATLGLIAYVLVRATFGGEALSMTVGIALFGASSVATTIGFLLPWAFSRLGYDPALGSGPLGTVIQDVLSLMIYFFVASLLVF